MEMLIEREMFTFEKLLLGYLNEWFMNDDCRRLLLQFLGNQKNLTFLVLNQNRLDNNKVVELLGCIKQSPAVRTL